MKSVIIIVIIVILLQLQGGGDMSLLKNFNTAAVRQGFVIDDVSTCMTEYLLSRYIVFLQTQLEFLHDWPHECKKMLFYTGMCRQSHSEL